MPRDLVRRGLPSGLVARVVVTDSRDGDLAPQADSAALETRQAGVAPTAATYLEWLAPCRDRVSSELGPPTIKKM